MAKAASKKKDPFRTLVKVAVTLAILVAVCAVLVTGIGALRNQTLARRVADVEAGNKQKVDAYNAALAEYQSATQEGESVSWPLPATEGWDVIDLSTFPLENTNPVAVERTELLKGGLLLVNQWHSVPDDLSADDLVSVAGSSNRRIPVYNNSVKLFEPAVDAIDTMLIDAGLQGLTDYIVQEGYRAMEVQQKYFDDKTEQLSKKYSGETLVQEAMKEVNYPGTSEYQSGYGFHMKLYNSKDSTITNTRFQESEQGQWVSENCWKYGILFRFPTQDYPNSTWEDKSYKTAISAHLNIYRYVGVPHSATMKALGNLCLEEYIEYLSTKPHIAVYNNGTLKYEIYRQEATDAVEETIQVPLAASYYVSSLDNMGGIITAFVYE